MKNIYLVCSEVNGEKLYKIGYTKRSIEERIKEFKTGNASEFYIIDSFRSKWASKIEARLHMCFKSKKVSGEWFLLDKDDILYFRKNCEIIHDNFEFIEKNNTYIDKNFNY